MKHIYNSHSEQTQIKSKAKKKIFIEVWKK